MLEAGARRISIVDEPPVGLEPRALRDPLVALAALLLLAAGVLSVTALFPVYFRSQPRLADTADQIVATVLVALGWLVTAGLVASGLVARRLAPSRRLQLLRSGALAATGLAIPVAGLRIADIGQLSSSAGDTGLWLLTGASVAGILGSVVALVAARRARALGTPAPPPSGRAGGVDRTLMVAVAVASVALGVAFTPAWDRYIVSTSANPSVFYSRTAGNAFQYPGLSIAGNVVVAVAFGLIPIVGLLWRPRRGGAALGAGTLVVAAAQVVAAVVQTLETPDPTQVLSPTDLQTLGPLGPVVSLHLTGWFDTEAGAVLALAFLGAVWASRAHEHSGPAASTWLPAPSPWGDLGNFDAGPASGSWAPPLRPPPGWSPVIAPVDAWPAPAAPELDARSQPAAAPRPADATWSQPDGPASGALSPPGSHETGSSPAPPGPPAGSAPGADEPGPGLAWPEPRPAERGFAAPPAAERGFDAPGEEDPRT